VNIFLLCINVYSSCHVMLPLVTHVTVFVKFKRAWWSNAVKSFLVISHINKD
jgi:hypothetical protein